MSTDNHPERVCAFFSSGPHFRKVLKTLRSDHPAAELWAVIPPRYPRSLAEELADRVEVTELDHYSLRSVSALLRLVRQLRAIRCRVFVVMFDSPKLAMLARLSGAPERRCHTLDGRVLPVQIPIFRQILSVCWRRLRGRWLYAQVRHAVRQPVGEQSEDR